MPLAPPPPLLLLPLPLLLRPFYCTGCTVCLLAVQHFSAIELAPALQASPAPAPTCPLPTAPTARTGRQQRFSQ